MYNLNDVHIAKRSMSLRASYGGVHTIVTIWKGNTLVITWNRLSNSIMFDPVPHYLDAQLTGEDEEILVKIIKEYLEFNKLT